MVGLQNHSRSIWDSRKPNIENTRICREAFRNEYGIHKVVIGSRGKQHYVGTFGHDLAAATKVAQDQEMDRFFLKYTRRKRRGHRSSEPKPPPPLCSNRLLTRGGGFPGSSSDLRILSRFGRFWAACGAFCLCIPPKTFFFSRACGALLSSRSSLYTPRKPKFSGAFGARF